MIYVLVALKSELPNIEDLDSSKIKVWYTGVGKINATVTATLAANQKDCERMINFGTAGTLEPLLAGKILEVGAVRQRDMDTRPHASLGMTPFETSEIAGDITLNPESKVILSTGDNFVKENFLNQEFMGEQISFNDFRDLDFKHNLEEKSKLIENGPDAIDKTQRSHKR